MDIVRALLSAGHHRGGAHINQPNRLGRSPLHAAAQQGHTEVAAALLAAGARLDQRCAQGRSPLHAACRNSHAALVQLLVDSGACIDLQDVRRCTPLHVACRLGHLALAVRLSSLGADAWLRAEDGTTPKDLFEEHTHLGGSGSEPDRASGSVRVGGSGSGSDQVCQRGDVECVPEGVVDRGAAAAFHRTPGPLDPQSTPRAGHGNLTQESYSLLCRACDQGHMDLIADLLHAGACVNPPAGCSGRRRAPGPTPLHFAAARGAAGVVRALLSRGAAADLLADGGVSPLLVACGVGHVDVVRMLLSAPGGGRVVDARCDESGTTALFAAACSGHLDVVRAQLSAGAAVDLQDRRGASPLWAASQAGHLAVVHALLSASASVDLPGPARASPLWISCRHGHAEVARALLSHGADVELRCEDGITPLAAASYAGHLDAVAALISEGGAQVDPPGSVGEGPQGMAPLYAASQEGRVAVVRALLAAGAEVDTLNRVNGLSPLHVACSQLSQRGRRSTSGVAAMAYQDVVAALIAAGASPSLRDRKSGVTAFEILPEAMHPMLTKGPIRQ